MIEAPVPHGITWYLVGGLLIGAGVALLFVTTGLIGGMSTAFSAVWSLAGMLGAAYVQGRWFGRDDPGAAASVPGKA